MAVENNGETRRQPGGITGRGFMPGQSGNPGGRPRNLARLIRTGLSDGDEIVAFYLDVLRGNQKALGCWVRLRDRLAAGQWLSEHGWGRAPIVVDLPEEVPQASVRDQIKSWAERLPPDVREIVAEKLDEEFQAQIEAEIAVVDEAARKLLPTTIVLDRERPR